MITDWQTVLLAAWAASLVFKVFLILTCRIEDDDDPDGSGPGHDVSGWGMR